MAEMETSRLDHVERNSDAALALSIIVLLVQVFMVIFIYQARQKVRALHQSSDTERGLELQNTSRGVPTRSSSRPLAHDPQLAAPAPTLSRDPVGRSPAQALGRPVAAYESQEELHGGEADDYYNPAPVSRRPTYAADSGTGEQTHGTDYSKTRRSKRYEERHNTNRNDADYGRKGDKFAHGT